MKKAMFFALLTLTVLALVPAARADWDSILLSGSNVSTSSTPTEVSDRIKGAVELIQVAIPLYSTGTVAVVTSGGETLLSLTATTGTNFYRPAFATHTSAGVANTTFANVTNGTYTIQFAKPAWVGSVTAKFSDFNATNLNPFVNIIYAK